MITNRKTPLPPSLLQYLLGNNHSMPVVQLQYLTLKTKFACFTQLLIGQKLILYVNLTSFAHMDIDLPQTNLKRFALNLNVLRLHFALFAVILLIAKSALQKLVTQIPAVFLVLLVLCPSLSPLP